MFWQDTFASPISPNYISFTTGWVTSRSHQTLKASVLHQRNGDIDGVLSQASGGLSMMPKQRAYSISLNIDLVACETSGLQQELGQQTTLSLWHHP